MPKFSYKAINEDGKPVSGSLEAKSAEAASTTLYARGFIPSKITKEREGASSGPGGFLSSRLTKIKARDLILFTKQFRTMIRAGVPMLSLLQILESQTDNAKLKHILSVMVRDINEGISLYDAFKKHPQAFSQLYCSMVQAGEASGALPEVLDRLIYIIEHEHKIKSDIKSAFQYPIFVIVFLVIAFFVLLTFVIPKFATIFLKAGIELPVPTQICLFLYQMLSNYWHFMLIGGIGGALALNYYLRTEQGRFVRDFCIMRLPIVGPLFIKAAMSRFASIFAIFQSSGVAVLDSMKILSKTIGNAAISREFDQIRNRIQQGSNISTPLKSAKYFTPMVVNMVAIGEESEKLDEMLIEVAEHYDSEVEYAMHSLSEAIGPILTVGLAGVVGFFALAIFLPMWDLTKLVK